MQWASYSWARRIRVAGWLPGLRHQFRFWALQNPKLANKSLLEILETENQFLESIQERFLTLVLMELEKNRKFHITCFFEELPMPIVGQIVSKDSAKLAGFNAISIHSNHRDMARFASEEDNGFKRVLGELARWQAETR